MQATTWMSPTEAGNPRESRSNYEAIKGRSGLQLLGEPKSKNVVWITTSDNDLQAPPWFPMGYQSKLKRLGYESYIFGVFEGAHLGAENSADTLNALRFQYSLMERELK